MLQTLPVVLTAPAQSYDPDYWPYQIQELQGGLEGIFPIGVTEVIPKNILQSFLLASGLVQSHLSTL